MLTAAKGFGKASRKVQVAVGQNAAGAGNVAAGRVVGLAGTQPQMFIGTEYRYPTEYEIWYFPQGTNHLKKLIAAGGITVATILPMIKFRLQNRLVRARRM